MRLTGSFQTIVTQGASGRVTSWTSVVSWVVGALLVTHPVWHEGTARLSAAEIQGHVRADPLQCWTHGTRPTLTG
jgi:hypothetical protein